MFSLKTTPSPIRAILALTAALLLALRVLSPAGFMPAFDQGAVTIVICPDAEPVSSMTGHHHDSHSKKLHQPCPYAAASSPGAMAADLLPLTAVLVIGLALLIGRPFVFLERHRAHERPPLRGPPLPA